MYMYIHIYMMHSSVCMYASVCVCMDALGTITVPNASACPSRACGCMGGHAWSPAADSPTRSTPRLSTRAGGRAARAHDAYQ